MTLAGAGIMNFNKIVTRRAMRQRGLKAEGMRAFDLQASPGRGRCSLLTLDEIKMDKERLLF